MCDAEISAKLRNSALPKTANSRCRMPHPRPRQILVGGVYRCQQLDVCRSIAPCEAPPLHQSFHWDAAPLHPAPHQARHLCPAETGRLHQKPAHNTFLSFVQFPILLTAQRCLDQAIGLFSRLRRQADLPIPRDELPHFGQTQLLQILHGDVHLPAACTCWRPSRPPAFSGPSCIGNQLSFQAHRPLETDPRFRLILYWTILGLILLRVLCNDVA
jgi:hypothetical protein